MKTYGQGSSLSKLGSIACFCGIICLATAPAILMLAVLAGGQARAQDVFLVSGVTVDQIDRTAAAARDRAIAVAHRLAFNRLTARLLPRAARSAQPTLELPEIVEMVSSFGIDKEKRSNVRYLAELVFRFRREAVRRYFRENNLDFAETRSKPALVLPVMESAGALLLWDKPNPWYAAWSGLAHQDGLMPLVLPAGDLADIRDINAEQAVEGDSDRLDVMRRRYGTVTIILSVAKMRLDATSGRRSLDVVTSWIGGVQDGKALRLNFPLGKAGNMRAAARETAARIEDEWKNDNLLRSGQAGEVRVRLELNGLGELVEIRRRLQQLSLMVEVSLVSVSLREALLLLKYSGTGRQLRIAAAQQNLVLLEGQKFWTLRRVSGKPRLEEGPGGDLR